MLGTLTPVEACNQLNMNSGIIQLQPVEPGWQSWDFGLHVFKHHFYLVVHFSHEDAIDRGIAVARMRSGMKNLINWMLLGQSLLSGVSIRLASEDVVIRYQGETGWVAHPLPETPQAPIPPANNEALSVGATWLPYLLSDSRLLYALQDYSSSLQNFEFCLFLLWRSVEWILWEFETRTDVHTPTYASAMQALALPDKWIEEIARLAHSYTRHARIREEPSQEVVNAARKRVSQLIMRYIDKRYKGIDVSAQVLVADALTGWSPPAI